MTYIEIHVVVKLWILVFGVKVEMSLKWLCGQEFFLFRSENTTTTKIYKSVSQVDIILLNI